MSKYQLYTDSKFLYSKGSSDIRSIHSETYIQQPPSVVLSQQQFPNPLISQLIQPAQSSFTSSPPFQLQQIPGTQSPQLFRLAQSSVTLSPPFQLQKIPGTQSPQLIRSAQSFVTSSPPFQLQQIPGTQSPQIFRSAQSLITSSPSSSIKIIKENLTPPISSQNSLSSINKGQVLYSLNNQQNSSNQQTFRRIGELVPKRNSNTSLNLDLNEQYVTRAEFNSLQSKLDQILENQRQEQQNQRQEQQKQRQEQQKQRQEQEKQRLEQEKQRQDIQKIMNKLNLE